MAEAGAKVRAGLPDLRVVVLDGVKVETGSKSKRKSHGYHGEQTITLPAGEALHLVSLGQVRIVGEAR